MRHFLDWSERLFEIFTSKPGLKVQSTAYEPARKRSVLLHLGSRRDLASLGHTQSDYVEEQVNLFAAVVVVGHPNGDP
jgi:hypothetical protein